MVCVVAVYLLNFVQDAVAHAAAVEGLATDIHERVCISCGLDGSVRFWDLSDVTKMLGEIRF